MINRRSLITGLVSFVAAPAIVRASNLMPVKAIDKQIKIADYMQQAYINQMKMMQLKFYLPIKDSYGKTFYIPVW